uniref:Uncharacterized protein n=1 Tax=Neobodo designis TaxID=312471 RepID=A0A7S1QWJ1_NEODS
MGGARRVPISLLVFYFFVVVLTIGNYSFNIRFEESVYGETMVMLYLVFTITGTIAYFFIAGVAWLWAGKYSSGSNDRVRKTAIGAFAMALAHDVPLFTIEWVLVQCCGFETNAFLATKFVFQCVAFAVSFIVSWLMYTYVGAEMLQYWYAWPTADQDTISAAKLRMQAEASKIKAHFTREWHDPGTEIMSPDERPAAVGVQEGEDHSDSDARFRTPRGLQRIVTALAPSCATVTRSRVDTDGRVYDV